MQVNCEQNVIWSAKVLNSQHQKKKKHFLKDVKQKDTKNRANCKQKVNKENVFSHVSKHRIKESFVKL